MYLLKP